MTSAALPHQIHSIRANVDHAGRVTSRTLEMLPFGAPESRHAYPGAPLACGAPIVTLTLDQATTDALRPGDWLVLELRALRDDERAALADALAAIPPPETEEDRAARVMAMGASTMLRTLKP